jgi:hypothetical protein
MRPLTIGCRRRGATRDTAGEPFLTTFTPGKAAEYLDLRRHNLENNCYACHASGAYMAARPLIDPLADGVMETRAMMERFAADFTAKPPMAKKGCQVARAERNRRSTTGPGSPALANAISLSVDRTQLTNCRFCSTESCLASFGGISPSVSCSCTCYQTSGCCLTCSKDVKRCKSSSPSCFSVE